jgi:hypothetical protein
MLVKNQPWSKKPSKADMVPDVEWNMWKVRQSPFLNIEDGDEVAYVSKGGQIMWLAQVQHLVKAPYSSHEETWDLMQAAIPPSIRGGLPYPLTKSAFLKQDYTSSRPATGRLLAFSGIPVRWIDRARPVGFKFRPNGWGHLPGDAPVFRKSGSNRPVAIS